LFWFAYQILECFLTQKPKTASGAKKIAVQKESLKILTQLA